jgi:hypothetical protein
MDVGRPRQANEGVSGVETCDTPKKSASGSGGAWIAL